MKYEQCLWISAKHKPQQSNDLTSSFGSVLMFFAYWRQSCCGPMTRSDVETKRGAMEIHINMYFDPGRRKDNDSLKVRAARRN